MKGLGRSSCIRGGAEYIVIRIPHVWGVERVGVARNFATQNRLAAELHEG